MSRSFEALTEGLFNQSSLTSVNSQSVLCHQASVQDFANYRPLHKQAALAQIYPSEMSPNCCFLASDNIVPRACIFTDANQQKLEVRYAIAIHRALFIPALRDNGNRIVRQ